MTNQLRQGSGSIDRVFHGSERILDTYVGSTHIVDQSPLTILQEAVWYIDATDASAGNQTITNLGTGGSVLNATAGSSSSGLRTGQGYVYLPGVNGNYLRTPDASALRITGDLDIMVKMSADSWVPPSFDAPLVAKYTTGQKAYLFQISTAGRLVLAVSANGSTAYSATSTAAPGLAAGAVAWLRVTWAASNGATTFYTSDDGASWAQLGAVQYANAGSINAGTSVLEIGANEGGAAIPFKLYRAVIKSGIDGTTVLDVDCTNVPAGATAFTATTGQVVTVNNSGADSNDPKYLSHSGTNYVYLPGVAGNYLSVPNESALQNLSGDMDVRAHAALDDWTSADTHDFVTKDVTARQWYFAAAAGNLQFVWWESGGTLRVANSSAALPFAAGADGWVRVTLDVDNGSSQYDVKFWTSTDGSSWSQLGVTLTGATGVSSVLATTDAVMVGASGVSGGSGVTVGKVYRAQILNGINGTTVLDVDTSVITSGSQTSFTATTGQVCTINRSTSGRKTVAVTAPCWLFGTDDYMEVADNDLLDFGATESFTAFVYARDFGTNAAARVYLSKRASAGVITQGWQLYRYEADDYFEIGDGTNGTQVPFTSAPTAGVIAAVRNVATDTWKPYVGGVAGTPATDGTTGSLANASTMRVGAVGNGGYVGAEVFSAAVWRRPLTASEISLLSTYFAGRCP